MLGLLLGGPTLMVWGTDEQKERFLPPILSAEEIWCQGFSEPDAGSDLAALKTRAVKDGDDWVVTGQKVWTSGAQYSKWCMLVARTDGEAAKHKGLTYFLMDMEQEAVQVRPLRQITGEAEFNELFIEEARIPDENVVGGVGNGWKVALTTLMNERAGLGFALQVRLRQQLDDLFAVAAERGLLDDPLVADKLADLHVRTRADPAAGLEGPDRHRALRPARAPRARWSKWLWSDTNQQLTQLAADIVGPDALTAGTQLELRAAARPRQLDRGRHDRGAQEHRRRARARPAAAEGGGVAMDFGLTDDQRDIQRTARELLGSRATPERVREHAEAGRTDEALWKELAELGWPGIAVAEEHGGQGLGTVELAILCEELGRTRRAGPVPADRARRDADRARRLRRAARALAARAWRAAS